MIKIAKFLILSPRFQLLTDQKEYFIKVIGGSGEVPWTRSFLLMAPKMLNFMHFLKFWQNDMLASPGGWAPLLRGIMDPPLKM